MGHLREDPPPRPIEPGLGQRRRKKESRSRWAPNPKKCFRFRFVRPTPCCANRAVRRRTDPQPLPGNQQHGFGQQLRLVLQAEDPLPKLLGQGKAVLVTLAGVEAGNRATDQFIATERRRWIEPCMISLRWGPRWSTQGQVREPCSQNVAFFLRSDCIQGCSRKFAQLGPRRRIRLAGPLAMASRGSPGARSQPWDSGSGAKPGLVRSR
jgi:hypothetical protein